ncbi:MAG: response regulator [Chryseolinea sp.]
MIKKFLLADDDQDDTELFEEALKSIDNSIELSAASNGKEALQKLAQQIAVPEIIFLDINMPEMDGWDCLTNIKKSDRFKDIPVVMFSTSSATISGQKAIQSGAIGYLEKPTSYLKLRDFLRELSRASQHTLLETMRSIESSKAYNFFVA